MPVAGFSGTGCVRATPPVQRRNCSCRRLSTMIHHWQAGTYVTSKQSVVMTSSARKRELAQEEGATLIAGAIVVRQPQPQEEWPPRLYRPAFGVAMTELTRAR